MEMIPAEIHERAFNIIQSGPSRVMVEPHVGVPWKRRPHVRLSTIFLRDDGWSLGAPEEMVAHAFMTWKNEWVAVIEFGTGPTGKIFPIHEWVNQGVGKWLTSRTQKSEDLFLRYSP